jgi:hypothetical protein
MKQFDGDVVEGAASVGAGDVGKAAAGVADLAITRRPSGLPWMALMTSAGPSET